MIRLPLIIAGSLVAAAAAVAPAVVGLTDNPSFSHQVPVRVPAHATVATFPTATPSTDGRERNIRRGETESRHRDDPNRRPSATPEVPVSFPRRSEPEPGDDRGRGTDDGRHRESGRHGGHDG